MYQVLHATSVTLRQFLLDQITADPFLAGPDAWTAGLVVLGAWALDGWVLAAAVLERRDV